MQLEEVLGQLERAGTAQNRKVYARHGVGPNMYGVSYSALRALAKRIRTDQGLAQELWGTGNHDARVLATLIADPGAAPPAQIDRWAGDLDNYVIADAFSEFVSRTPHVRAKAEKWMPDRSEWTGRAGWRLATYLAMQDAGLDDGYFEELLATIESDIRRSPNWVRDAMNGALIAIGCRNAKLTRRAIAVAKRIGPVEVDHGETGCKTPDAVDYIQRTLDRRQGKAAPEPPKRSAGGPPAGKRTSEP